MHEGRTARVVTLRDGLFAKQLWGKDMGRGSGGFSAMSSVQRQPSFAEGFGELGNSGKSDRISEHLYVRDPFVAAAETFCRPPRVFRANETDDMWVGMRRR